MILVYKLIAGLWQSPGGSPVTPPAPPAPAGGYGGSPYGTGPYGS